MSVLFLLVVVASSAFGQTPKYIILFIGDGMGPNHRILAEKVSQAKGLGKLEMNHLPVRGEAKTNNVQNGTTDSAASATAIACGVKTNNGWLGMKPDETTVDSFVVDAKKAGWKVGIITTDALNGATPAGFYAHVKSRHAADEILAQAAKSGVDFFGGPRFNSNKLDVDKTLREGGYDIVKGKIASDPMPKLPCANLQMGSMAETLQSALRLLENPTGFFIMVESSHIDGCSHGNRFPGAMSATIEMNDAVRVALDFLKKHPEDTLIVTTADHECGGLKIVNANRNPGGLLNVKDPDEVEKIIANDIVGMKPTPGELITNITEGMGLEAVSEKDRTILIDLYQKDKIKGSGGLVNEVKRLMYEQAGILWTTGGHTPANVPTTAAGAGSEAFQGTYENTHIADAIRAYIRQSTKPQASAR
ncbi:MAG: alkaline phosphatase [Phycisphaerae bacterium]|nr:alkaline phosphatase [Phycisphaerae bacterium]